jgi:hypothetical protein
MNARLLFFESSSSFNSGVNFSFKPRGFNAVLEVRGICFRTKEKEPFAFRGARVIRILYFLIR